MKKIIMTLAAVLCCALTTTVFTSCGSDDDDVKEYTYSIGFDNMYYSDSKFSNDLNSFSMTEDLENWINSITDAYKSALGVTESVFKLKGKEGECDAKVFEACKKAEETVKNIKGGSATVVVTNSTTCKKVYTYDVQR